MNLFEKLLSQQTVSGSSQNFYEIVHLKQTLTGKNAVQKFVLLKAGYSLLMF